MKHVVTVVVRDGEIVHTLMRSPGLPDGDHDLVCEPTAPALPPRMDVCDDCGVGYGDHWPACSKAPRE